MLYINLNDENARAVHLPVRKYTVWHLAYSISLKNGLDVGFWSSSKKIEPKYLHEKIRVIWKTCERVHNIADLS